MSAAQTKRKTAETIKQDPLASRLDIGRLTAHEMIAHPNCPSDLWWELATQNPIEAKASVLYDLFTLESPERWQKLEADHVKDWIETAIKALSWQDRVRFAADCAEQCLHLFEAKYPDDKRPREAIEAARKQATEPSETNKKAATYATFAANAAYAAATNAAYAAAAANAAYAAYAAAAANAAYAAYAAYAAANAAYAAAAAAAAAANAANAANAAYAAAAAAAKLDAQRWQWERIQRYTRGER